MTAPHPSNPSQLNSQLADAKKATEEALFDIIVGIINGKEDHPDVHLELTRTPSEMVRELRITN